MTCRSRLLPLAVASAAVMIVACGNDATTNAFSTIEVDPAQRTYSAETLQPILLTVRNTGQGRNLKITRIRLLGEDGQPYVGVTDEERNDPDGPAFRLDTDLESSLPATIAPRNETDDNLFQFTLHAKSYADCTARSVTLAIENDNTAEPTLVNYTIVFETKPKPFLTLPATVDFGQVKSGEAPTREVSLTNTGTCELVVDWFTFDGDAGYTLEVNGAQYKSDESADSYPLDPPVRIAANSTVRWKASYTPQAGEPATARVVVHSTDPGAVDGKKQVELTANSSGPCIRVEPTPVEFGGKLIGKAAGIDVTVKSCGTGPLTITGIDFKKPDSNPNFTLDFQALAAGQPSEASPLTIPVNGTAQFRVKYLPTAQNPIDPVTKEVVKDRAWIVINNSSFNGNLEVEANGFGVTVECPQPIIVIEEGEEVKPQTTLHLHGDQSQGSDGAIKSYSWKVDQPPDNKFGLVPSNTFDNPTHTPNIAGDYTYCLDVCDNSHCSNDEACHTTACKKVTVIPDQAIHCELTWTTPGDKDPNDEGPDAGADMDLHFAHPFASGPDIDADGQPDPWFDIPYDCFWFNGKPDWESMNPNAKDDPRLDRDDTDGWGPENVNLDVPVDGRVYHVGAHFWDDHGYGYSNARVKCYIWGQLVFDVDQKDSDTRMYKCDMWDVATIEWPAGAVHKVTKADGSFKITAGYINPAFVQIGGGSCASH